METLPPSFHFNCIRNFYFICKKVVPFFPVLVY